MGNARRDPRVYQISALGALLLYGIFVLGFDVSVGRAIFIIGTALATQFACTKLFGLPSFDPKSSFISAFSVCLLLRTNSLLLVLIGTVLSIASKFFIRWNGKHVFNPTNFGIVVLILLTDQVWVSPGQWGSTAFYGFLVACIGTLVVNRAARSDVTFAFVAAYAAMIIGRAAYLGDPITIPLHKLENGALILFSFFMISDPKTTPDSRIARILFAILVAAGGAYLQIKHFRSDALLLSLAAVSVLTPLLDALFPARRYEWSRPTVGRHGLSLGTRPLAPHPITGGLS